MQLLDFLDRLEDHLATHLAELDVRSHPSSEGPSRLIRHWTIEFVAAEAAKHAQTKNLAALLRNVNERGPELGAKE